MPTSTNDNPFAPRSALSREQLERYARGELSAAEQHAVELHLAADPLLQEATEGLAQPGAADALNTLRSYRPAQARGTAKAWFVVGSVAVAVCVSLWWLLRPQEASTPYSGTPTSSAEVRSAMKVHRAELNEELTVAVAPPESLRSGAASEEPFEAPAPATGTVVREEGPARLEPRPVTIEEPAAAAEPISARPKHASRKLLFLRGLKLVHPKELYPADVRQTLVEASVDARFGEDGTQSGPDATDDRAIPYDRYFDEALGRFAAGNRRGCLEDLLLVLDQRPGDVNALFYAGLCCHDLGLFPRAVELLDKARSHQVDTFVEEAEWYHALSVEQASGKDIAQPLMEAVIARGGYYAARAKAHLLPAPLK